MSIGSPTGTSSLVRALQVCTHLTTPAIFSGRRESPALVVEEEMDAAPADGEEESDEELGFHYLSRTLLVSRVVKVSNLAFVFVI